MNPSNTCSFGTVALLIAVALGCEAVTPSSNPRMTGTANSVAQRPEWENAAADDAPSNSPMKRITLPVDDGASDGIAVVRWQLFDNPSVLATFFKRHPPSGISPEILRRLASNGILVAEVPLSDLPKALDDLGGTYANIRAWLGQATTWHQLSEYQVRGSCATVVDGATRRFGRGTLQLLLRGWTVPLESGAVTDVEILPAFLAGAAVPGARATQRESFPSAGFFVSLKRGSALLLTGMIPNSGARSSAPGAAGSTGSTGTSAGSSAGPPVAPPPTIGELLLTRSNNEADPLPQRPCIVVIPMIPASNFLDAPFVESNSKPSPP